MLNFSPYTLVYDFKMVWGYNILNYDQKSESGIHGDFDCDVIKLRYTRLIIVLL